MLVRFPLLGNLGAGYTGALRSHGPAYERPGFLENVDRRGVGLIQENADGLAFISAKFRCVEMDRLDRNPLLLHLAPATALSDRQKENVKRPLVFDPQNRTRFRSSRFERRHAIQPAVRLALVHMRYPAIAKVL